MPLWRGGGGEGSELNFLSKRGEASVDINASTVFERTAVPRNSYSTATAALAALSALGGASLMLEVNRERISGDHGR